MNNFKTMSITVPPPEEGKARDRESAEVAEINQDGLGDDAVEFEQQVVGDKVGESAGEVVYSDWKGLKPYKILKASDENLEKWKREIDQIVEMIKAKNVMAVLGIMNKNGRQKGDPETIKKIIEEEILDETEIILFAIGLFLLREKSPWRPVASRLKLLKGGNINMESFFERNGNANCYDTTIAVKTLAQLYGIEGDLRGKWILHSFFETKDEKISDVMYGWRRAGIFHSAKDHDEYIKQDKGEKGLVSRAKIYLRSKEK